MAIQSPDHTRTPVGILALCSLFLFVSWSPYAHADPVRLTVRVDEPGAKISPNFYGLMTEEINHSCDGGLYGQPPAPVEGVFASASRDTNGDIILKIVNIQSTPQQLEFGLQGVTQMDANATIETLTGQPNDVNSIAEPMKVSPKRAPLADAGPKFSHEFPAYSASVLRLKGK
jgi:hypothetical protein